MSFYKHGAFLYSVDDMPKEQSSELTTPAGQQGLTSEDLDDSTWITLIFTVQCKEGTVAPRTGSLLVKEKEIVVKDTTFIRDFL